MEIILSPIVLAMRRLLVCLLNIKWTHGALVNLQKIGVVQ